MIRIESNKIGLTRRLICMMMLMIAGVSAMAEKPVAKKLFVFGDSMTGWMAERLQAYGEKNGFEVSTLIWDGATIKKYGNNSEKLKKYISSNDPDAVIVCLGMNEMASPNPEVQLGGSLSKIKSAAGNVPILWVGPCAWPGKPQWGPALDSWLKKAMGDGHYYSSQKLTLPRQSNTNPHPTREGMNTWTDHIVDWIESGDAAIALPGYSAPAKAFSRPKNYTYLKMKSPL